MKKFLLLAIVLIKISLSAYCKQSDYIPLVWTNWQLWRSPYGVLDLSKGNFLPYSMKTAFFPVKGYNHCIMRVYEASLKFGEITAEDNPYIILEIDYDDKGRVTQYKMEDKTTFGGTNYCIYEREGDKLLSENHYNSNHDLIGMTVYKYDDRKRISAIDLVDRNNQIFKKTKYSYGNNGQIKRFEYNKDGEERCAATDIKDVKGRLIKQSYMEGGSTIVETFTYNEYGLIKKINSSKTFVYNGVKDETFKGKLFDEYKYRYDQKGNVVERLALYSHPFGQKYEWIKCEYSNKQEANNENSRSSQPTSVLLSSNPNDICLTINFNDLYVENKSETYHLYKKDMDDDGIEECFYFMKKDGGCAMIIEGGKMKNGKIYKNRYEIPLDEKTTNNCKITAVLHDFNYDDIYEVVIAWIDMGVLINGKVFWWGDPNDSKPDCFIEAGQFASSDYPLIDGNTITTKAGLINAIEKKYTYSGHKLVMEE